ncbi:MAG TPA: hypothetical protein V6D33_05850, partial [Cyanophyceae cyanobacterium]
NWASKMTRFAVRVKLTPTARELWAWIAQEFEEGKECIIDLMDFNNWVSGERGTPHDNRIIIRAAEQLEKVGVLIRVDKWRKFVWKFTLRSVNYLISPPELTCKNSQKRSQVPNLAPSNPSNADDSVTAAAALNINEEEIINACEEAGITYTKKSAITWATLPQVKAAIALFFHRGGFGVDADGYPRIENPQGFLIKAIKKGWIEEQENIEVCSQHLRGKS